jgi:hypothetical protein
MQAQSSRAPILVVVVVLVGVLWIVAGGGLRGLWVLAVALVAAALLLAIDLIPGLLQRGDDTPATTLGLNRSTDTTTDSERQLEPEA